MLTALRGVDWAVERLKPVAVVEKPFELKALLAQIERVLSER